MRKLSLLLATLVACSQGTAPSTTAVDPTVAATTQPDGTVSVTAAATTTTTTLSPRPELSVPQVVYFLLASPDAEPSLTPVWRDETSPQGVEGAIRTLLTGPTPSERLGVPALSTDIPAGSQLNSVNVVNGLATIDLAASFYGQGDPRAPRLAQVIYTATRFENVDSVAFRLDGKPFAALPGPTARIGFRDLQGMVFIEEPPYGGPALQPGRLVGEARTAGDAIGVRVTQAEGLVVAEFDVDVAGDGWVPIDAPLPYSVEVDQNGEMVITSDNGVILAYPLQLLLPAAGSCSAAGLSPIAVAQDLPPPVADTRQAIISAATACDLDALAALGSSDFTYTFGSAGRGAADFWRSEEAIGIPVTRLIVQLLNTPPVLDTDFLVPTYLWPSAFRAAPTAEDFDLLEGIIPNEDLDLYRQFNEYLDLRLGISADGLWEFAVAGD